MAMESARSMSDHQINVIRQMPLGSFRKTPIKKIYQKSVMSILISYMSLSTNQVQKLGEELDRIRAIAAQKVDQRDYVDLELVVPSHLAGLARVSGFMSNYCSASNSCWISNQSPSIIPITTQCLTFLVIILHQTGVKEWHTTINNEPLSYSAW